jgi:hypothetical protein
MSDLNMGARPLINFALLDAELRAALPGKLDGISQDKHAGLTVHVVEGEDAAALRPQIAAVIAVHNPTKRTPEQDRAARRVAALGDVNNADFVALWHAIDNASSLAAVKPLMKAMLLLQFRVALASGLTDADEPGA